MLPMSAAQTVGEDGLSPGWLRCSMVGANAGRGGTPLGDAGLRISREYPAGRGGLLLSAVKVSCGVSIASPFSTRCCGRLLRICVWYCPTIGAPMMLGSSDSG